MPIFKKDGDANTSAFLADQSDDQRENNEQVDNVERRLVKATCTILSQKC